jgi:hypothetical protein
MAMQSFFQPVSNLLRAQTEGIALQDINTLFLKSLNQKQYAFATSH